MRKARKIFFLLSLLILFVQLSVFAQESPQLPHLFYGLAQVNGLSLPVGSVIVAKVEGVEKGQITITETGKYGGSSATENKLIVQGDIEGGAEIQFFLNNIGANELALFESGKIENKNFNWVFPAEIEINQAVEDTPYTCLPETTLQVNLENLSLTINCDTARAGTIDNISTLATPTEGAIAVLPGISASPFYEISISGEVEIIATITYDETGLDEETITVYKFDGTDWVPIPPADIIGKDTVANTITFRILAGGTPYSAFGSSSPPSAAGGGANDITAPTISEIKVVPGSDQATITWKTNESSISRIVYGTSTAYGLEVKTTSYITSHSLVLLNLSPSTTYHFQVKSRDSAGNIGFSDDRTFTTLAKPIKGDINGDSKVDKYDFALMMANWGKTGANTSDLNGNKKVDKYDFAILMANWSVA